jgi:hypothetical protein
VIIEFDKAEFAFAVGFGALCAGFARLEDAR